MDREDVRQSLTVIQSVIKEVNSGRSYLIFPEGTRSKSSNDLLEFHNGSFRCALKTKCPVIPIALVDCYKVLDQKGSKPVTVQIHYLKPIPYEEYQNMNTKELAELVRDRIEAKVKECTQ
jgi:1-acyl-sn-glycerol-3-phosphate acyltransferase